MPFVENEGVKLHYKVEGEGPPIVLIHGFTGSTEGWYKAGYVEALKDDYQLVLIDLRGNGLSDKSHNIEDYSQEKIASDITAVMDDLEISKAHLWGWSWGGAIGIIVAKYYPERFHSFIIGGAFPQELSNEQKEEMKAYQERFKGGEEAFFAASEKAGEEITPEYKKTIESWDFKALYAHLMGVDLLKWETANYLTELDIPFLFYEGEEDTWDKCQRHIEFCKKMKNAKCFCIPKIGHGVHYGKSELVLPPVLEFLKNLEKLS